MKIDKTYLQNIVEKYGLVTVAEEMERRLDIPTAKLGFIGLFSSGKSSLLNTLLNTKLLPEASKPTTRAICIIEPIVGLESPHFFRDTAEGREDIDYTTFLDIINGDSNGDAVIQLPVDNPTYARMFFVDTPGIDSMDQEDAERTYAYLSLMDAAVVCIDIEDGTLKKYLADFITSALMHPLWSNLVFVLTKTDTKSAQAGEAIRGEIIRQLDSLCANGDLQIRDIADRVVAVSRKNAKEILTPFLQKHCFSHLSDLVAAREKKELKALSAVVAAILKERATALSFDATQYEEAIDKAKKERAALESDLEEKQELWSGLEAELAGQLHSTILAHKLELTAKMEDDARMEAINRMLADIRSVAETFASQHVSSFVPGPGIVGAFGDTLDKAMWNVDFVSDKVTTVATAITVASISGVLTGLAGNAVEMGTGALVKEGAKITAKTRFLAGVSQLVQAVNPYEWIARFVAGKIKSSKFDDLAFQASRSIAGEVVTSLASPYQREVIAPLRLHLEEIERGLTAQRDERHKAAEELFEERREMAQTAKELEAFAGPTL